MSLAEIARKQEQIAYEPWGRDVVMVPISARDLCDMHASFAELQGKDLDTAEALEFYAELLSLSVMDPKATKEEWLSDVTPKAVMDLGQEALRLSGLVSEDAKKN